MSRSKSNSVVAYLGSWFGHHLATLEKGLKMAGIIVFVYALLL